jgi:hypothetical protein
MESLHLSQSTIHGVFPSDFIRSGEMIDFLKSGQSLILIWFEWERTPLDHGICIQGSNLSEPIIFKNVSDKSHFSLTNKTECIVLSIWSDRSSIIDTIKIRSEF